jgi:L-ascorbate metabolism protein UlaG (beta-lactamase superfamily)
MLGIHYGTFDLTDEPLDEAPRRFHAEAARRGLPPDRLWTPALGETLRWRASGRGTSDGVTHRRGG